MVALKKKHGSIVRRKNANIDAQSVLNMPIHLGALLMTVPEAGTVFAKRGTSKSFSNYERSEVSAK